MIYTRKRSKLNLEHPSGHRSFLLFTEIYHSGVKIPVLGLLHHIQIHNMLYRIQWQLEAGPGAKEGGLFLFGMFNDIINNRVVGHEHGNSRCDNRVE